MALESSKMKLIKAEEHDDFSFERLINTNWDKIEEDLAERGVNIDWFHDQSRYGNDHTMAFTKAQATGKVVFIPNKDYNVTTDINLNQFYGYGTVKKNGVKLAIANPLVATSGGATQEAVQVLAAQVEKTTKSQRVVDIAQFNIKSGSFNHKPPYSVAEYEIAYNNMEGFKMAFAYYKAIGVTSILFPTGFYPFCYRNPSGGDFNANTGWEIKIPSNMDIDFGGSTMKVIFDSLNKNPYDKSPVTVEPWKLTGKVFSYDQTHETNLRNGILAGDRYDRAYSTATTAGSGFNNEQGQEQTYGFIVQRGSQNNSLINMTICGFMGDAVTGNGSHDATLGTVITSPPFYPGYIGTDGTVKTDIAGAYSTNMLDVNIMTGQIMMVTNIGYTRIPNFVNQIFDMSFYNKDNVFLSQEQSEHLSLINMPVGTKFIRISIFNETPALESITNKVFRITPPQPAFFTLNRCNIFDNNRGGLSNLPHDVLVQDCHIYENGKGGKMGWKQFPDTTRYGINCEDAVSRKLTVRGGSIHDVGSAILVSAKDVVVTDVNIKNCDFAAMGVVFSNRVFFKNNSVFKVLIFMSVDPATGLDRTITMEGNVIEECQDYMTGDLETRLTLLDNNNALKSSVFKVPKAKGLRVEIPVQRKPIQTSNSITGELIDTKINIINPRVATTGIVVKMGKTSQRNTFNLNDYNIGGNYEIYGTKITGGFIFSQANPENNIVKDSELAPVGHNENYYSDADTTRTTTMTNTTLRDSSLTTAHFFSLNKNSGPAAGKVLNSKFVFEDCIILIDKPSTLRLFNITPTQLTGGVLNVRIEFKNCKFINNTATNVALANTETAATTKSIVGCTFTGNFGFTNN